MNYVDNTEEPPTVLSICTGLRGLERGIERVIGPIRAVAYVEIEAFLITNLVAQMESGLLAPAPIWSNLKTFPSDGFHRKIHIITGGYPCQPFSTAGIRRGEEDPRHLWPYIEYIIKAIRPVFCFFENVPGHLTLGYETVKRELEEMGYTVKEGIYSAEEVGAPHCRERLFILAKEKNVSHSLCYNGKQVSIKKGDTSGRCQPMRNGNSGRIDRFPAERKQPQYEWEPPRTVESSLGSCINGYNFREDLLRGLGNGVVEQTAELAFRDLLRKHGI